MQGILARRRQLVAMLTAENNRLPTATKPVAKRIAAHIRWLEKELSGTDGDLKEAIRASEAVGDDRLQRRATGEIRPDSFTHGSSAQRAKWFRAGQASGEPADCDTFSVDEV